MLQAGRHQFTICGPQWPCWRQSALGAWDWYV